MKSEKTELDKKLLSPLIIWTPNTPRVAPSPSFSHRRLAFVLNNTSSELMCQRPQVRRRKNKPQIHLYPHFSQPTLICEILIMHLLKPFCRVHLYSFGLLSRSLLSITRRGTDDSCDDIALSKSYTEYIFFMSHF